MIRVRRACKTNEPQAMTVTMLTLLNIFAWCGAERGLPSLLFALLLWPAVAFIANLVDPIK